MGALSVVGFAFNTAILPELQVIWALYPTWGDIVLDLIFEFLMMSYCWTRICNLIRADQLPSLRIIALSAKIQREQKLKTLKLLKSSCLCVCVLQADVRPPTARNIYKALGLQYTLGAIPIIGLTLIGYWAYGNVVSGFILESNSGPKWLVTVAKVAAFFQILVTLHVSIHIFMLLKLLLLNFSQALHEAWTHLVGIFAHL